MNRRPRSQATVNPYAPRQADIGFEREALLNLVARVAARDGAAARISETDVRQWPAETVGALQAHRLLLRARPARTVLCPGCEADRVMPVQTIPAGPREAA